MRTHLNVLSIDGGGVRGIIPALFLEELEKRLQEKEEDPMLRLADVFDLFVGTSTGGILTMGYVVPGADGRPKYSASDGVKFYTEDAETVFKPSIIRRFKIFKILENAEKFFEKFDDETHSSSGLESVLKRIFKDAKLKDAFKRTVITSFDIGQYKPAFFKSYRSSDNEHLFREIARVTSAAPTFFEPVDGETLKPKIPDGVFIDGGIMMNNPVIAAITEAIEHPERKNRAVNIVSLSCGDTKNPQKFEKLKDMIDVFWAQPIVKLLMDATGLANHYQAKYIVPQIGAKKSNDWGQGENASRYFRYYIDLYRNDGKKVMEMDDSRPEHIDYLRMKGQEMIEKYDEKSDENNEKGGSTIDDLVARLLQS